MKRKRMTKKQKLEKHRLTLGYLASQKKKKESAEFNKKVKLWKKAICERDNYTCQKCGQDLTRLNSKGKVYRKHPHHIITLDAVVKKYPELLEDLNNGVLLCPECHIYRHYSAHEGALEFVWWLKENKPEQYDYLINKIKDKKEDDGNRESRINT